MIRACKKLLVLALGLLLCTPAGALATQSLDDEGGYIAEYLDMYDCHLTNDVLRQIQTSFEPQEADCGSVRVRFNEILYDGQWMYTSASIWPKDPDAVLVLPGDAQMDDPLAGLYGEQALNDQRTFKEAAKEDGKRLLSVYAYMKEFDDTGAYFLDHFQEENSSILFSGSRMAGGSKAVECTWSVQIFEVNLQTSKYTFQEEYLFPMTIPPIEPYVEQAYRVMDAECPFEQMILAVTPLGAYTIPQWNDLDDQQRTHITLITADEQLVSKAASPAMDVYSMDALPQQITLSLVTFDNGVENEQQVTLVIENEPRQ